MTKTTKRGPLDFIKDLTEKKTPWESLSESDKKAFSPYIIDLWLGMNPDLIEFVNEMQRYTITQLKPKQVYKLYLDLLPKMKLPYSRYIKGKKTDKYNPALVELIAKHFWISKRIAEEYIDVIPTNDLEIIIRKYGKTDAEIKKLLK